MTRSSTCKDDIINNIATEALSHQSQLLYLELYAIDSNLVNMLSSLVVTAIFLLTSLTDAWGELGHETIAWIAESYVSPTTKQAVQGILDSTRSDYMANVSTWADSYRYTRGGAWSAPLHYIDANDHPPESCSVDYSRDCGDAGCSVSAIVNYTSILLDDDSKASKKLDAVRFIIHFIGDLHQRKSWPNLTGSD